MTIQELQRCKYSHAAPLQRVTSLRRCLQARRRCCIVLVRRDPSCKGCRPPGEGICRCVCLSVRKYISPGLNVRSSPNFMCMLPIRQSSPGDVAICYVLSILRMTSYVHRPNWGMSIVLQSAVIEWRNSSSSCASWHPYCVVLVASCPIKTVGTETRRVHRAGGVSGAQPAMHQCLV